MSILEIIIIVILGIAVSVYGFFTIRKAIKIRNGTYKNKRKDEEE